uniref:Helicase-associated domain-containing protein n=1 Tax=Odontella aurita TaxID=265563 RepID=A0A7S4JUL9_9STRA|mmetsp:Transcript_54699/g.163478  ORF Transcript_54699/g.163478 Transcript_54699/m.163478 type:complete len:513 (+) Transcript_54699:488-2026(+)
MPPKLDSGGEAKSPTTIGASSKSTAAANPAGDAFAPPRTTTSHASSSSTSSSKRRRSSKMKTAYTPSESKDIAGVPGKNNIVPYIAERKQKPPATKKASVSASDSDSDSTSTSTHPRSSRALPPPSGLEPSITALACELRIDDPSWLIRYQELIRYHRHFGHVDVPRLHSANIPLASWVHNQRKDYKRYLAQRPGESGSRSPGGMGTARCHMTSAKEAALEKLGFKWDLHGAMWDRRYDELRQFLKEEGHVDVPQRYAGNPSLGRWVNTQRLQQRLRSEGKKSDMTPERYAKLGALGMVWYVKGPEQWNVRFDELIKYKQTYGNCEVPSRYGPNRKLGRWVSFQRTQYRLMREERHSHLTEERMKRLEAIGFSWMGITMSASGKSCGGMGGLEGGSAADVKKEGRSMLVAAGEAAARAREKKASGTKSYSSGAAASSPGKKKSVAVSSGKVRDNEAPTTETERPAKKPRIKADPDASTAATRAEAKRTEMDKKMEKRLKAGSEAPKATTVYL